MKTHIPATIAFLLALAAQAALAHEYWPVSGDYTCYYEDESGAEVVLHMHDGRLERTEGIYLSWASLHAESGNLYLSEESAVALEGAPPFIAADHFLTPAVVVLEGSVAVGQSWSSSAEMDYGYDRYLAVTFQGASLSEQVVDVPAGSFATIAVDLHFGSTLPVEPMFWPSGTYYLSPGVGPVILPGGFRLVRVEGIVATDETSWSRLKAAYR